MKIEILPIRKSKRKNCKPHKIIKTIDIEKKEEKIEILNEEDEFDDLFEDEVRVGVEDGVKEIKEKKVYRSDSEEDMCDSDKDDLDSDYEEVI
jgi:hypothetical protein